MAAWLIAAIERLPPRVRRAGVAATAVLLLGGAITSLTLEASTGGAARRSTPAVHGPSRRAPARPLQPRVRPPVSSGRPAPCRSSRAAVPRLVSAVRVRQGQRWVGEGRHARAAQPADQPSALRRRRPSAAATRGVVSLGVVGTTPGFVLATATVDDGGIAAYRLRFALREQGGRWLVSDVQEG